MSVSLGDLCEELHNWFWKSRYFGTFTVSDGTIDLSDMVNDGSIQDGQYFRVVGSVFNDGVYSYPAAGLNDEQFDGAVWAMAVPLSVIQLLGEINAWIDKYSGDSQIDSPYQSESFGGYSYSKSGGGSGSSGSSADAGTWQNQFQGRLEKWRKQRRI